MIAVLITGIIANNASAEEPNQPLFDALNGKNTAYHSRLCELTQQDIKAKEAKIATANDGLNLVSNLTDEDAERQYIDTELLKHWKQQYVDNCRTKF